MISKYLRDIIQSGSEPQAQWPIGVGTPMLKLDLFAPWQHWVGDQRIERTAFPNVVTDTSTVRSSGTTKRSYFNPGGTDSFYVRLHNVFVIRMLYVLLELWFKGLVSMSKNNVWDVIPGCFMLTNVEWNSSLNNRYHQLLSYMNMVPGPWYQLYFLDTELSFSLRSCSNGSPFNVFCCGAKQGYSLLFDG